MKMTYTLCAAAISLLVLASCEQVIHPELQSASPIVVVDAWINNSDDVQEIVLTRTQGYFDSSTPAGVAGASVVVRNTDTGTDYVFTESSTAGHYRWTPPVSGALGTTGHHYALTIIADGETYLGASMMGRVPSIDSITFRKDKRIGSGTEIHLGEFWATDPAGPGDTYWIRATKNGVLLNKPSELIVAYDAGFSGGSLTDGVVFISPIRTGINPNETAPSGKEPPSPYLPGDSVYVQLQSISLAAFNYLTEVATQTNRPGGFAELFATPLANVSTNITAASGKKAAAGFFNVAAVTGRGQKYIAKP